MKKLEQIISIYDEYKKVRDIPTVEQGLFCLFKAFKSDLEDCVEYVYGCTYTFIKQFRQAEFVEAGDAGYVDMAIWNLLNGATLFWDLFDYVHKVEQDEDAEQNYFGFRRFLYLRAKARRAENNEKNNLTEEELAVC